MVALAASPLFSFLHQQLLPSVTIFSRTRPVCKIKSPVYVVLIIRNIRVVSFARRYWNWVEAVCFFQALSTEPLSFGPSRMSLVNFLRENSHYSAYSILRIDWRLGYRRHAYPRRKQILNYCTETLLILQRTIPVLTNSSTSLFNNTSKGVFRWEPISKKASGNSDENTLLTEYGLQEVAPRGAARQACSKLSLVLGLEAVLLLGVVAVWWVVSATSALTNAVNQVLPSTFPTVDFLAFVSCVLRFQQGLFVTGVLGQPVLKTWPLEECGGECQALGTCSSF